MNSAMYVVCALVLLSVSVKSNPVAPRNDPMEGLKPLKMPTLRLICKKNTKFFKLNTHKQNRPEPLRG